MSNLFIAWIIDDDTINQFVFTKIIAAQKFTKEIVSFLNAELAITFLEDNIATPENLPDVIFVDINMPMMDGWDFLEEYKKLGVNKKTLIYLLSSSINPYDIEKAQKIPLVSGYIIKPIKNEKLKDIIASLHLINDL
jgi:CheY-like chemotaxis protein